MSISASLTVFSACAVRNSNNDAFNPSMIPFNFGVFVFAVSIDGSLHITNRSAAKLRSSANFSSVSVINAVSSSC